MDDHVHAAIFAKVHLTSTYYRTRTWCSPKKGHCPVFGWNVHLRGLSNALLILLFDQFEFIFGVLKYSHALSGILLLQQW